MNIFGKYSNLRTIVYSQGWHPAKDVVTGDEFPKDTAEITLSIIDGLDDRLLTVEQQNNLVGSPNSAVGVTIKFLRDENDKLNRRVSELETKYARLMESLFAASDELEKPVTNGKPKKRIIQIIDEVPNVNAGK